MRLVISVPYQHVSGGRFPPAPFHLLHR